MSVPTVPEIFVTEWSGTLLAHQTASKATYGAEDYAARYVFAGVVKVTPTKVESVGKETANG